MLVRKLFFFDALKERNPHYLSDDGSLYIVCWLVGVAIFTGYLVVLPFIGFSQVTSRLKKLPLFWKKCELRKALRRYTRKEKNEYINI
eukprot:UN00534